MNWHYFLGNFLGKIKHFYRWPLAAHRLDNHNLFTITSRQNLFAPWTRIYGLAEVRKVWQEHSQWFTVPILSLWNTIFQTSSWLCGFHRKRMYQMILGLHCEQQCFRPPSKRSFYLFSNAPSLRLSRTVGQYSRCFHWYQWYRHRRAIEAQRSPVSPSSKLQTSRCIPQIGFT